MNVLGYVVGLVGALVFIVAVSAGISLVGPRTEAVAAESTPGMVNPYATLDTSHIDDLRGKGYAVATESGELLLVPDGSVLETTPMVLVPDTAYVVPEESPDGGHVLPYEQWRDDSPLYSGGWLLLVNDAQHTVSWRAPLENVTQVQNVAHVTATAPNTATWSRQCVRAAKSILWAHRVGVRVEEDLSYRHMPRRVAQCNDVLATAFYADGHDFSGKHGKALRTFLRGVISGKVSTSGQLRAEDGSLVPPSFYDHVAGPTKAHCDRLSKHQVPDATYGTRCV